VDEAAKGTRIERLALAIVAAIALSLLAIAAPAKADTADATEAVGGVDKTVETVGDVAAESVSDAGDAAGQAAGSASAVPAQLSAGAVEANAVQADVTEAATDIAATAARPPADATTQVRAAIESKVPVRTRPDVDVVSAVKQRTTDFSPPPAGHPRPVGASQPAREDSSPEGSAPGLGDVEPVRLRPIPVDAPEDFLPSISAESHSSAYPGAGFDSPRPAPPSRSTPVPGSSSGALSGSGFGSSVPLAALLALLALAAPAILRRFGEVPAVPAPAPFVCGLERPG